MSLHQDHKSDTAVTATSSLNLTGLSGREYYDTWLARQCSLVAGACFGVLVMRKEDSKMFQPVSIWPDSAADMESVSELIDQVIEQQCGLITRFDKTGTDNLAGYALAYPILIDDKLNAVIAVIAKIADNKTLKFSMQQLEWGCAWIGLLQKSELARTNGLIRERLGSSIDLLAKILAEETADAAALRLVSELAALFNCDRVSIGFIDNKTVKVQKISNSAQFGRRMNLIRAIEAAMEEAVDQLQPIALPRIDDNKNEFIVAHQALVEQESENSVLTIPLYINQEAVGAITMEREVKKPFSEEDLSYCESICAISVSALVEKRKNDRLLILKIIESFKGQLARVFGPGHLLLKCSILIFMAAGIFLFTATSTYKLSADAKLKGALLRAIVAPYDGYIDSASVRAGDRVKKDEVLVTLDVRDFNLEKLKWISQIEKLKRQRQEALAGRDRAGLNIISAQLEQAQVQLELVEMQLDRAVLRSPFSGIVVSGDLSQRLGGSVAQGDLLFEISPLDNYRVDLKVKENRIADIETGQKGLLYLSAIPEKPYEFTVTRVTPTTISEDRQTFFMVEAELRRFDEKLQIGMEGVAKINIDERKTVSIWSRDFIDWARLQFWSLSG